MFAHVEEKLLCRIAGDMRERRLSKNETLFTEGELGDAVYTIVEGTIGLQCSGLTVLSRASGECVGEFAMLDGAPRSASAVAVTDAVLLEWSRNDFRAALQVSGGLTRGFFKTMTAKLRQRMTNPRAAAAAADRDAVARRRAVKEVFEVISRLPSADRDAYLEHHHPGDHALRAEVAELLEFESKLGDFMESDRGRFPAAGDASGRFLDRYRLDRRIGSGGMGEVYAGVDTQLGRPVAVKILPPHLAGFASFRRRFENEAQAIAALDHPNIVTIHSVEEADGVSFIVMELVSGRTLTELIANGGVAIADFFEIAIPLARAVADAHAHGITHRDLKPDNIMVDERGTVKVLDFGLAKTAPLSGADGDDGRPTLTKAGEIVGTVPYMSPEQAEGKSVDERSDVFTLGINFYELLSGCYPFEGDSATSVMASILRDEPKSLTELNPKIPSGLSELVARCLDKTADRRYPARVVVEELERIQRSVTVPALAGACRTSM